MFLKELEDGSKALGFFNRGDKEQKFVFNKLSRVGIAGKQHVRDLWRQKDLPDATGKVEVDRPPARRRIAQVLAGRTVKRMREKG